MIEEIKDHLSWYKWIYIIGIISLCLLGYLLWYEYAYPCISGHNEVQYYLDPSLNIMMPHEVFVCDCRTVRDSLN